MTLTGVETGYDEQLLVQDQNQRVQASQRRDRYRFRTPDQTRKPIGRVDGKGTSDREILRVTPYFEKISFNTFHEHCLKDVLNVRS